MENKKKYIIAVDFDGTIVEHKFPAIGDPVPGAVEWLKKFQSTGFRIILYTMRSDDGVRSTGMNKCLTEAVNYLKNNGIELFGINNNPEQHTWTDSPKVYAHFYIDDAAIGCPLIYPPKIFESDLPERPYVDWDKVGNEILDKISGKYTKSH